MSGLFARPGTVALQAPLSMEFSRQKYWSGSSFPSPGDLPDPEIEEAGSLTLPADSLSSEPPRFDPLEKGMAAYSSILAWRTSLAEEPDGLQSMGTQSGGYD